MATPLNTYELTYIVNAVLNEEQIKAIIGRINRQIEENGGQILEVDEWGTRRLAYPLHKKRNGYFVNMYFKAPGEIIARLERSLEIDDDILRYLTLRFDAKMLRHYEKQQAGAVQRARAQETAPVRPAVAAAPVARAEEEEEEEE